MDVVVFDYLELSLVESNDVLKLDRLLHFFRRPFPYVVDILLSALLSLLLARANLWTDIVIRVSNEEFAIVE